MNQSFVMPPDFFDPPTTICGNVHHLSSGGFGCVEEGEEEEENTRKNTSWGFRYSKPTVGSARGL